MSENYILERILKDARSEADAMISDANLNAEKTLKRAKEQIGREMQERLLAAQKQHEREMQQIKIESDNETAKSILLRKQQIISEVFESAKVDLLKMDDGARQKLADALTKKYSKKGDTVTALKQGGVFISNAHYDLELSLDALLSSLREQIENEVAEILF